MKSPVSPVRTTLLAASAFTLMARGQMAPGFGGSPPSAVLASSTTYPSPQMLLHASAAAYRQVAAYRIDERSTLTEYGKRIWRIRMRGDVRPHDHREHLRLHAAVYWTPPTYIESIEMLEIKRRVWLRDDSTHQRWKRVSLGYVRFIDGFVLDPLAYSPFEHSGLAWWESHLATVGPETFHGILVWHVRGTDPGVRFDWLIARQGFLPYSISVVEGANVRKNSLVVSTTRSHFGEAETIRPPPA